MKTVLLYMLLMMGITFIIGFSVAYLIKLVTYVLYLAQQTSFSEIIKTRKRMRRIGAMKGIRTKEVSQLLQKRHYGRV